MSYSIFTPSNLNPFYINNVNIYIYIWNVVMCFVTAIPPVEKCASLPSPLRRKENAKREYNSRRNCDSPRPWGVAYKKPIKKKKCSTTDDLLLKSIWFYFPYCSQLLRLWLLLNFILLLYPFLFFAYFTETLCLCIAGHGHVMARPREEH